MAIRQFLLKPKPTLVFLALKDMAQVWYPSRLAKQSGASYVYVTHWLSKLEKAGWVKMEKKGRLQTVLLTERGLIIANSLDDLVKRIEMGREAAAQAAAVAAPSLETPHGGGEKKEGEKKEKSEREGGEKEKGEKKEKEKPDKK